MARIIEHIVFTQVWIDDPFFGRKERWKWPGFLLFRVKPYILFVGFAATKLVKNLSGKQILAEIRRSFDIYSRSSSSVFLYFSCAMSSSTLRDIALTWFTINSSRSANSYFPSMLRGPSVCPVKSVCVSTTSTASWSVMTTDNIKRRSYRCVGIDPLRPSKSRLSGCSPLRRVV